MEPQKRFVYKYPYTVVLHLNAKKYILFGCKTPQKAIESARREIQIRSVCEAVWTPVDPGPDNCYAIGVLEGLSKYGDDGSNLTAEVYSAEPCEVYEHIFKSIPKKPFVDKL